MKPCHEAKHHLFQGMNWLSQPLSSITSSNVQINPILTNNIDVVIRPIQIWHHIHIVHECLLSFSHGFSSIFNSWCHLLDLEHFNFLRNLLQFFINQECDIIQINNVVIFKHVMLYLMLSSNKLQTNHIS